MDWIGLGRKLAKAGVELLPMVLPQAIAQPVREAIGKLVGADKPEPDLIAEKLDANPELLVQLKQYEMDHEERLMGYIRASEDAHLADAANLRQQVSIEVQSADPFVRRARPSVIWAIVASLVWGFIVIPTIGLITRGTPTPTDFPMMFWAFTGTAYLGYGWLRYLDKRNAPNGRNSQGA